MSEPRPITLALALLAKANTNIAAAAQILIELDARTGRPEADAPFTSGDTPKEKLLDVHPDDRVRP